MTVRGDWTGKWAAERIEPDAVVESVEILTENQLLIHRNNGAGVVTVATVGGPCLTEQKVTSSTASIPAWPTWKIAASLPKVVPPS